MFKRIKIFLQNQMESYKKNRFSRESIFKAEHKFAYIIKNWLFFPIVFAVVFSLPLYVSVITYQKSVYFPYISAVLGLISVLVFLNINKRFRFAFGFFIALLWFYWIGLSFRFTGMAYLGIPAVAIVCIIYGIVFWVALFFNNPIFRAITLSLMGYMVILGFDWFVPDAVFAFSIFKVDKISFVIIVAAMAIVSLRALKWFRFLALALLLVPIDYGTREAILPKLNMLLTQMNIPQDKKWGPGEARKNVEYHMNLIEYAINKGYDVIVLPETTFTVPLNQDIYSNLRNRILKLSNDITIVLGAIRDDKTGAFNSTYVFDKNSYSVADKMILAPFGEYNPIPSWAQNLISKITGIRYGEFNKAKKPGNIVVKNFVFRNAICYEATSREMYRDKPRYMMLLSNNAWFKPSIEPVLQMMLIKYYARQYNTIVFHSANGSNSMVITPDTTFSFVGKTTTPGNLKL